MEDGEVCQHKVPIKVWSQPLCVAISSIVLLDHSWDVGRARFNTHVNGGHAGQSAPPQPPLQSRTVQITHQNGCPGLSK